MLVSPQGKSKAAHANAQKFPAGGTRKDLWIVVREGSLADVDAALALLKKNGGNVNSRNVFGLTPLHIATWRNHIPIVRRLLAAGADPDARDGESGWGSLHRALHFGHLSVAGVLLQNGASITLEDSKSRTPVDLLSGPVLQVLGDAGSSVATEVFSWGSGANYQLGTGNAHIQKLPCKVDALHGSFIKMVSAAKFHSVAVTARGEVYTWGFGRGGRLGHPDFDIHSGQAAVITPRQLTYGLGSRRVKAIAAAKHHTVLATLAGEVFTWGSNREGQLGYTVDTQPTPRRVSSLKSKIIAVAAANKHTAVVSDSGEIFTWGCNREGQLGYGTSNSASNYTPRVVEYLKNKDFKGVAAAKYHTIVLGADGEHVYTWGHRLVTPRRVFVTRNLKRNGSASFKFYRMERLHVAAIAAGVVHSLALTDNGTLFYWASADPDLKCQELYALYGKSVVSISAGKYWSAAATVTGDVYMWDAKKAMDKPPVVSRLHGMKRATQVSVGETHLIMIGSIYHPTSLPNVDQEKLQRKDEVEELDEDFMFNDQASSTVQNDFSGGKAVPSLKALCENVAIENIVEPRNAIQMLEIADALAADELRKYCEDIAIHNLDYILTVQSHSVASASPEILARLESLLDKRSSEPWSYRRLPTPTATLPVIINSEAEDSESEVLRTRDMHATNKSSLIIDQRLASFLRPNEDDTHSISKQLRALRKKLQQIEMLKKKQSDGHHLDDQQIAKLQTRSAIETALAELGFPVETLHNTKSSTSIAADVKGGKKAEVSRKQRRKGKQKVAQMEVDDNTNLESIPVKDALHAEISHFSIKKEEEVSIEFSAVNQAFVEHCGHDSKKDNLEFRKAKSISPIASKKKSRKGGLSLFLSGALDEAPHDPTPPPPTPKNEGPAWGGAKLSKGFASLREIQDEQSKTNVRRATRNKDLFEPHVDDRSDKKVPLSSFLPSKPIPMDPAMHSDLDKNTPPWASGTPPLLSRPSLRDIQMQQGKKQQSLSHSPKTNTAGFAITSGQGSPSDSSGLNRWFKPEIELPSSFRSIQIEEKAMKDLKRFYGSVKIVKNPS